MLPGFLMGILSATWGIPMIVFCFFHPVFMRSVFGIGMLTEIEFDTYYTLTMLMHALIGYLFARALKLPSVFTMCYVKLGCPTKDEILTPAMTWKIFGYRFGMGVLLIMLMTVATLPFELIEVNLIWLGIVLTLILVLIIHVLFFFIYGFRFTKAGGKRTPFKVMTAPYYHHDPSVTPGQHMDMTIDVMIYMAIYYIPTAVVFMCVVAYTTFWQFWVSLILFGFYLIFIAIAGLAWLGSFRPTVM